MIRPISNLKDPFRHGIVSARIMEFIHSKKEIPVD